MYPCKEVYLYVIVLPVGLCVLSDGPTVWRHGDNRWQVTRDSGSQERVQLYPLEVTSSERVQTRACYTLQPTAQGYQLMAMTTITPMMASCTAVVESLVPHLVEARPWSRTLGRDDRDKFEREICAELYGTPSTSIGA